MVLADTVTVERARRMGPLGCSALAPAPAAALPAAIGPWLATELDTTWDFLGRPDPLVVVDLGGRCASATLGAGPRCAPALRWLLVAPGPDESSGLALEDPAAVLGPVVVPDDPDEAPSTPPGIGPLIAVAGAEPSGLPDAVVVAADEIGRLAADRYRWRDGRWWEVRLAAGTSDTELDELLVPAGPEWSSVGASAGDVADRAVARRWLARARRSAARGLVVVVDRPAAARGGPWPPDPAAQRTVSLTGHLSPLVASTWTMIER